jgi:hypothetical protein
LITDKEVEYNLELNKLQGNIKLAYEIKQQWYREELTVVPIVLSVTGVVPNILHKSFKLLSPKAKPKEHPCLEFATLAADLSVFSNN